MSRNHKTGTGIVNFSLVVLLLILIFMSISCTSQIPVASNYLYSEQQKMQAAHHWDVLADDVVRSIQASDAIWESTPIVVLPKFYVPDAESVEIFEMTGALNPANEGGREITVPFKRAYQNYLISRLVNAGYNVIDRYNECALLMIFDIQVIKQVPRECRSGHAVSKIARLLIGSADGAYVGIAPSQYEVVITTSVKDGNSYITSHTGTYYINIPPWESNYAIAGKIMEVTSQ